jgi:hypothetical protein
MVIKISGLAGRWWLMPVLLVTQEADYQEDGCSKLAQANSRQDPISEKPITKRDGGVAQGVDPEFKLQYHPPKKCIYISILTLYMYFYEHMYFLCTHTHTYIYTHIYMYQL